MRLPTLETRVADLLCVLDAVDADRPLMVGFLSTGAVLAMAAAGRPDLARALVWLEPDARFAWAPDYPWGRRWEELDAETAHLTAWGTEDYARWFLESEAETGNAMPEEMARSVVRQGRNACTPDIAKELSRIWYETDVRGVLSSVQTPTLLLVHEERTDSVDRVRYIADLMPAAEVRTMPGDAWTISEQPAWLDEVRRFIGEDLPAPSLDTILLVRDQLGRHGGDEVDGFLATFDGPAGALRCAHAVTRAVCGLGIEVRAGLQAGGDQEPRATCEGSPSTSARARPARDC